MLLLAQRNVLNLKKMFWDLEEYRWRWKKTAFLVENVVVYVLLAVVIRKPIMFLTFLWTNKK